MGNFNEKYLSEATRCLESFTAFEGNQEIDYKTAVTKVATIIQELEQSNNCIYFVGNGGSAGIASHLALDFWKNANVKALAFNDSSLLTALGNDMGYEYIFSKSIEMFANSGDMVIAISSSGNSQNVLNAVNSAKEKGCKTITLSGFSEDNKLKSLGDINFHVPSHSYGMAEVFHTLIIHQILDYKLHEFDEVDIFNKNSKK
jgi:D-sedoheptulose 7-phosphate isomerase